MSALIDLPPRLGDDQLKGFVDRHAVVLIGRTQAVAQHPVLGPLPVVTDLDQAKNCTGLVVIGGGMRIDLAKHWRAVHRPDAKLLAIATRHGSGAEANGIAVLDQDGVKTIQIGPEYRPDARYYLPESLSTLSGDDLLWCAADSLTHAVEGLLSPMADAALRAELAEIIGEMIKLGPSSDPRWFELSALASAGQSQSSVGFVHGLAHELEGPCLAHLGARTQLGHARLCGAFLAPVLRYNLQSSDKTRAHLAQHGVDLEALLGLAEQLSRQAFALGLPWAELIRDNWRNILKNPCTRTNAATVRPGKLEEFLGLLPDMTAK